MTKKNSHKLSQYTNTQKAHSALDWAFLINSIYTEADPLEKTSGH